MYWKRKREKKKIRGNYGENHSSFVFIKYRDVGMKNDLVGGNA